jgi:hypothetical protein
MGAVCEDEVGAIAEPAAECERPPAEKDSGHAVL